ncbi:MAG: TolC family protein, partial [Alphaproteobacteria bacterium]|nr:TolC family protein [Alphaproteobacteria bacterium]
PSVKAFCLASTILCFGAAAPARAEQFATYLVDMLNNQPGLKASLYDVYSKGQFYDVTSSRAWNPTVVANLNFGKSYMVGEDPIQPKLNFSGQYDRNSYGITLTQNLFNGGVDGLNTQLSRAQFHLSEWQYLDKEQNLILQSALAYNNVIKARSAYQLQKWNNDRMNRILTAARVRFQSGTITRSDLAQSEALKALNDAQLLGATAALSAAYDEFQRLFGRAPAVKLEPLEPQVNRISALINNRVQGSKENWLKDFQTNNPSLQLARLQREMANLQKDINVGGASPKVDFVLSATQVDTNQPNAPASSKSFGGGINVTIPLWFQGGLVAGMKGAVGAARMADYQFADTSQQLQIRFNRSYDAYRNSLLMERAFQQAAAASRLGAKAAEIEMATGKRTLLELMTSLNNNLQDELNLINNRQDKITNLLQLQAMTGDLIAPHFGMQSPYRVVEADRRYKGAYAPLSGGIDWLFSPRNKDNPTKDFGRRQFNEKTKPAPTERDIDMPPLHSPGQSNPNGATPLAPATPASSPSNVPAPSKNNLPANPSNPSNP